jgi:dTDP-4-amino-4,6-dideoxygalactose transaminase
MNISTDFQQETQVPFLDLAAATAELSSEIEANVLQVLRGGWYLLGRSLAEFETEWARYIGTQSSVGVGNGLDAITLSLRALGIGPGDEVIVPANTYIASWLAVSAVGATIVPVEPETRTALIDPAAVAAAITPRTRAIMPVHLYGRAADMRALSALARPHGIRLVEDCAQAHGAKVDGVAVGAWDVGAWSFYPGKNLGALGDGGGVTSSDSSVIEQVRMLRNYGSHVKYHNEILGVNSRLDDMQAAALLAKLPSLDVWNERRRRIARHYIAALGHLSWLTLPEQCGTDHVWHLFVVQLPNRDAARRDLAAKGIQTLIHYPVPPHLQPAYSHLGYRSGDFPITERLHAACLSLPIGPHLTDAQVEQVVDGVLSLQG